MHSLTADREFNEAGSSGLAGLMPWLSPLPRFALVDQQAPERSEVEAYIQAKFSQSYGASLSHYLPLLVALRCADHLSGVAGVGLAARQPTLFLEQYLDAPVEQELARITGQAIARTSIAEVGNLVATTRGASRVVFIVLASLLSRAGLDWMVFTATAPLQASLRKLGFTLVPIQDANPGRLAGASAQDWGSYYQYAPQVVAGRLDDAMGLITERHLYSAVHSVFHAQIESLADQLRGEIR